MDYHKQPLFDRIKQLWTEQDSVYSRLNDAREDITAYFRPDLGLDYDPDSDMLMLGSDIYEGSGPWAARIASIGFQGNTVSKKLDWFKYDYGVSELQGIDELDEHAQAMREHMSSVYQRGNFYDVQPQFTLDGWTIGSPLHFVERDEQTGYVMFIPQHFLSYRLFYDRYNRCEGVIIKDDNWSSKQCFDKFCPGEGIEARLKAAKEKFTQPLYTSIVQGNYKQRFTIWRAVFKRTDSIWQGDFTPPVGNKLWYDVYFEDLANSVTGKKDTPLETSGYFSKPFVHWDYDKKLWETASRTPAFYAVYDTASQNQIFKNYLENLQLKVRPAVAILQGMRNRVSNNLGPQGVIEVDRQEWEYTPKVIENVGDIKLEAETIRIFKENLSRWFHLDLFRMFTQLAENTNQEFRVLQLAEMAGERISMLLPTMESHENYLKQVDARVRDIETQSGRGPFNRRDMENMYDQMMFYLGRDPQPGDMLVEFIGTLRQTQQMQQKLKPIQYGVSAVFELANAMGYPELARMMLKGYDVADEALGAVNFPQKLIREREEFDKMEAAFQEGQAQNEQFAKMIELMKVSKNITSPVDQSSILGQLSAGAA